MTIDLAMVEMDFRDQLDVAQDHLTAMNVVKKVTLPEIVAIDAMDVEEIEAETEVAPEIADETEVVIEIIETEVVIEIIETDQETNPEIGQETNPEIDQETNPEIDQETNPEIDQETNLEIDQETNLEIDQVTEGNIYLNK